MEEKNVTNANVVNKVLLVLVVILLGGILLFGAYVLGTMNNSNNNNDNNTNQNNTVNQEQQENSIKELSINDSLITSLVYPMDNVIGIGYKDFKGWTYKNYTIDTLGRDKMMHNAAHGLESIPGYDSEGTAVDIYSAELIESNFKKIYGPDINYYNGDFRYDKTTCFMFKYNEVDNTYKYYSACGGASLAFRHYVTRTYKAEQDGNNIYVYEYVQSVLGRPSDPNNSDSEFAAYLLDRNDKETTSINYDNYENIVYEMMDKGEVDTYKWTFKKQSDGKYYFYSGAWEN